MNIIPVTVGGTPSVTVTDELAPYPILVLARTYK